MFGYIVADKPELRIKEYHIYRAYYCGLCRAIGRYGQMPRFMLNYDCTFLYLLHSSLANDVQKIEDKNCIAHPLRRQTYILDEAADYAAAVNILLGVENLQDKKQDHQSAAAGAALLAMQQAYKKAKQAYPHIAEQIHLHMQDLQAAEQQQEQDLDAVAHISAQMLAEIVSGPKEWEQKQVLWEFGYQLGRLVYLADAWEDMPEDAEKGRYNIFVRKFGQDVQAAEESAQFNLGSAVNHGILAYDLLDIQRNKPILDNIVYSGIVQNTQRILRREKERNKKNGSL